MIVTMHDVQLEKILANMEIGKKNYVTAELKRIGTRIEYPHRKENRNYILLCAQSMVIDFSYHRL